MLEVLVEIADDRPPSVIIVNDTSQRIKEKSAFEDHIVRRQGCDTALAEHRFQVFHLGFVAVEVFNCVVMSELVFDIKRSQVTCPGLVNPYVGAVSGGNAVAKPLVRAFMNDVEVEPETDAHTGPIKPGIAVLKLVAVSDRRLVLHRWVGYFNQLVAVVLEWILAKIMLEGSEHFLYLHELCLGLVHIFRQ